MAMPHRLTRCEGSTVRGEVFTVGVDAVDTPAWRGPGGVGGGVSVVQCNLGYGDPASTQSYNYYLGWPIAARAQ